MYGKSPVLSKVLKGFQCERKDNRLSKLSPGKRWGESWGRDMKPSTTSAFIQVLLCRNHSRLSPVRKCCVRSTSSSASAVFSRSVSNSGYSGDQKGRRMPSQTSWSPSSDTAGVGPTTKEPATRLVSVDLRDDDEAVKTTTIQRRNALYDVDFGNHSDAFRRKTTGEIFRALCVLKMCGVNAFVNNSLTLFKWTRRVLGRPGLRLLIKPTFFKQFVGGETHKEIQECMARLSDAGIRPMLAATMEEDLGDPEKSNEIYNSNCTRILECMDLATAEATPSPMMQVKVTGITSADLVVKLGNIYRKCEDKLHLIRELSKCFSDEGAELKVEELLKELEKKEVDTLKNTILRLKKIAEEAVSRGIKLLVDAEYTYLNSGLSLLTLSMQAVYNRNIPVIWNTYQCYLKDAYRKVCEELSLTDSLGVYFGAKLVRGAYVVQERARAESAQKPCAVCDDYEATNKNYNKALEFLLNQTTRERWKCSFVIATHNEKSIKLAIEKMKELGIDRQRGGVSFGQLYGMSDDITYPLASSGYAVYKSIPYGTLDEVLPYLVRRAIENKDVLSGIRNEKSLLWKEMKHRLSKSRYRSNR